MRSPRRTPKEPILSEAVAQTRAGQVEPLTRIMQAHNQRLFRIARSVRRVGFHPTTPPGKAKGEMG